MLAEPVLADGISHRSTVRPATDSQCAPRSSATSSLQIAGQVRAGEQWQGGAVQARSHAIEIMTGAPMPEGADAVVMVEHVEQR